MDELRAQRGARSRRPRAGVDDYAAAAGPLIKQNSVTDPDLLPVYELIGALPDLPVGYASRDEADAARARPSASVSAPRVQDASDQLYQQALERLMRPRLMLSLEQQIQKNIDDPTFVYEALKVYLMLGGKAPRVDKELIVDWFTRDWEERTFPGAPYAQGTRAAARPSGGDARHGRRATPKRSRSTARWSSRRRRRWRACASPSAPTRC